MDVYDELIAFGRAAADEGLLISTCGNASIRLDAEQLIISASGSQLRALRRRDISVVRIADGAHVSGPGPSMEADLHCGVYRARPAAGAVLHCQSKAATILCCMAEPPEDLNFIPEIPAYVRSHAYVPYCPPGSGDLAGLVHGAFQDTDVTVVQMRNHGQTIAGANWRKVIRRGVFFELACWMYVNGDGLDTIPAEDVQTLRGYARDI